MKELPTKVSKRMLQVVPHVNSALAQFEAFGLKYRISSIYGYRGKHIFLHDFTLLLAIDDLERIGMLLCDQYGDPYFEHTIDMTIEPKEAHSPLLDIFKSACEQDGPCAPEQPFEQFAMHPPMSSTSFYVWRKGKRSKNAKYIEQLEPFLEIDWNGDDQGTGEPRLPKFTTNSHCDDTPPADPLKELCHDSQLRITQRTALLPHYAD